jgi:hypothetical protein
MIITHRSGVFWVGKNVIVVKTIELKDSFIVLSFGLAQSLKKADFDVFQTNYFAIVHFLSEPLHLLITIDNIDVVWQIQLSQIILFLKAAVLVTTTMKAAIFHATDYESQKYSLVKDLSCEPIDKDYEGQNYLTIDR